MICQNCHTEVDNDLIFCTNCGERLFQPQKAEPTVLINEPVLTEPTIVKPVKPVKPSSNLKWVALILALVAIPASIFGIFLLRSQYRQVTVNTTSNKTPTATPTRKANTNQNSNANAVNANKANTNATNANSNDTPDRQEVMNERIEIAPKEHYAVPFEIEQSTARLKGKVNVLEGDKVEVFVFIKSVFDEYSIDPVHKVSSFETRKSEDSDQVLVEEDYVLVFVNKTDKPLVIQGKFNIEPVDDAKN